MFQTVPGIKFSPPFGDDTVTLGGWAIVKIASLISFTLAFEASLTRTRACVVGVFGIDHAYDPADAEVEDTIVIHEPPLFVEYSSLTDDKLVNVHVMFCVDVAIQFSPPLGAVSVTLGGCVIVNTALLISLIAEFDASLILTSTCVEGVLGTVHE